jgi:hypothetical protein
MDCCTSLSAYSCYAVISYPIAVILNNFFHSVTIQSAQPLMKLKADILKGHFAQFSCTNVMGENCGSFRKMCTDGVQTANGAAWSLVRKCFCNKWAWIEAFHVGITKRTAILRRFVDWWSSPPPPPPPLRITTTTTAAVTAAATTTTTAVLQLLLLYKSINNYWYTHRQNFLTQYISLAMALLCVFSIVTTDYGIVRLIIITYLCSILRVDFHLQLSYCNDLFCAFVSV